MAIPLRNLETRGMETCLPGTSPAESLPGILYSAAARMQALIGDPPSSLQDNWTSYTSFSRELHAPGMQFCSRSTFKHVSVDFEKRF
jgi:hypothetical protein